MKKTAFLFASALLSMTAFLSVGTGCGDETGGSGGSGGTGGTGGTGGMVNTGGMANTGGTGGMAAMPSLTCDYYCASIMGACSGANAQYPDEATCKAVCAAFPAGMLGETSGNTLGCRIYHSDVAGMTAPDTHCPHAGPSGGDIDPTDMMGDACGEACDSFCDIAMAVCTGNNVQYADKTQCLTECKMFPAGAAKFSTADMSGDTYNCRLYHLTAAAVDPATHCAHIVAGSPVCK